MQVDKKFRISVNKKYTHTEVFSFEYVASLSSWDNPYYVGIRMHVAARACNHPLIPDELRYPRVDDKPGVLLPDYWVEAICIE